MFEIYMVFEFHRFEFLRVDCMKALSVVVQKLWPMLKLLLTFDLALALALDPDLNI